ncbi:hypothetical protein LH611_28655, partial [Klebsiella pneumoniae]|nr:hypothetical protein [Klebsiella pneumoniae]
FPQFQLTPVSTNISDHCPLILKKMQPSHYKAFRFENHWLKSQEFDGVVAQAWNREVQSGDPVQVLQAKLSRTTAALKNWYKKRVRWATFISGIANEVIFRLDQAQEDRELTEAERNVRSLLKMKLLGIAAIDR